ncbi:MAG: DegT/DnrJ/EryC1/StrS family aminotransferase [Actinomycetales bacterium]|nr:DegT/DnrJ/EryC1/StrS family aminotransferase [Actinomycetales bacterium]
MKAVVHEAGSVGERSSCLSGEWLWVVAWGSLLALAVGAPQGPGRLIVTDFVPFALPDVGDREIDAVVEAMRSGWLTTGPNAAAFEREFVDDLIGSSGTPESNGSVAALAVNSATAGLHLALEAIGVGPGDEVIVPTWTFTATAEVVRYLGATPVIVDVDPATLNIDLAAAEAAVTDRTAAIMPVHFAGLPVDRAALAAFAERHGVAVVEDAAHAHPVHSDGIPVGLGASRAVVFSFYATKTMTTGEGGMVVSADPALIDRMKTMRLHGISRDVFDRYTSTAPSWHYEVVAPGFKDNMTDVAAAMGRVQLTRSDAMREARTAIAARYDEAFADLPVRLPARPSTRDTTHAWHLYVVRLTDGTPVDRNTFIERMAQEGVGCSVHFIPLHHHTYWRELRGADAPSLPVADHEFARAVSLPIFSSMTPVQVDKVIEAVRSVLQ